MLQIIGVINQKGGVGKTTVAHNLAAGLVNAGRKVLMVDMDYQCSLTNLCGVEVSEGTPSLHHVFLGSHGLRDILRPIKPGLDLIPCYTSMSATDMMYANAFKDPLDRAWILRRAMEEAEFDGEYQVVILDCINHFGLMAQNAFAVMTRVVLPIVPETLCINALPPTIQAINSYRVDGITRSDFEILGLVRNKWDDQKVLSKDMDDAVIQHYGSILFNTVIRQDTRLAQAPAMHQDIFEYGTRGHGKSDFLSFTNEVLTRVPIAFPVSAKKKSQGKD